MANEQNLQPIKDSNIARQLQERSVAKRHENTARRKTLAEELLALLSTGDTQERISLAQVKKALNGDTKAYEVIRDTIGEKPTDKVENSGTQSMVISIQGDASDWAK